LKIVYFSRYEAANVGVHKKIFSQTHNLRTKGIEVKIIFFGFSKEFTSNSDFVDYHFIKSEEKKNIFQQLKTQYKIFQILVEESKKIKPKEILYIRFFGPNPFFLLFLLINRKFSIVTEHQSIEPLEIKRSSKNYVYLLSDFLFGKLIRKNVDAIVGVTEEITQYQINRSGDREKPHFTIGNGIDVEKIRMKKYCPFDNKELNLICVANVSIWHGIDRLIKGLSSYKGEICVHLHIVGDGPEINNLKHMVEQLKLENQVTFHGTLTGSSLDDVYDQSHIAVGSLALHRIGIHEATPLKVREYASKGIPFIIGYSDPDFQQNIASNFFLLVPCDDSIINIQNIIHFASRVYSDSDLMVKMRNFSYSNLDWGNKTSKLFHFLEAI